MTTRTLSLPRFDTEGLYTNARMVVRILFVTVNNLYCIPVHLLWLIILQPIRWVATSLYWHIEGIFFQWLLSMVAFWSYSGKYHIVEIGDDVWDLINERVIVLFNHQSTSDVPLIMAAFNSRRHLSNNVMWIMDSVFKLTNFGIVSLMHGDFFIKAGKKYRESSLKDLTVHLKEFYIPRKRNWLILFPEGGFLKNRKPSSQNYAQKNNLPHLENVALPRVGALKVILDNLAASHHTDTHPDTLKYLLDVTVAYPGGRPLDLQTLVGGWRPSCNTIFHYRRFNIEEIPRDEVTLTKWLYDRYVEKEEILQQYYDTGTFPAVETPHEPNHKPATPPAKLPGTQLIHDPLEFLLRHIFYILSTWMWASLLYLGILRINQTMSLW